MRRRAVLALLLVLLSGTGCWDARSLDQRAFVTMLGIDTALGGQFRVSIQVQRSGFEQKGRQEQGGAPEARVLSDEGETVREAIEHMRDDLAREIDTTFLDVIVLGRAVAEARGLEELDFLVRTFRIPVSAFVAVAPADAETVVRARAVGYGMPAHFALFGLTGGNWSQSAAIVPGPMWLIFNRNYFTPLEDPYAPVLASKEGQLNWAGLAIFRGRKLAGILSEQEAVVFNLLAGTRSERTVTATVPEFPGAKATLYIQRARTQRRVTWEGSQPIIRLSITARGTLQELTQMRTTSARNEAAVEQAIAGELGREVKALVRRFQEVGSDPIGFGELARQADPYRNEVQSGDAWLEAFRDARLDVTAKVIMVSPGYMK